MRQLVPGLDDTVDKATVMEHAVDYLIHLSKCESNNCHDYKPKKAWTDLPEFVRKRGKVPRKRNTKAESGSFIDQEDTEDTIIDVGPASGDLFNTIHFADDMDNEEDKDFGMSYIQIDEAQEIIVVDQ
jgi:hypothetical protein